MSYLNELNNYFNGENNIFSLFHYLYKYNLLFYVIYLLIVKRSYIEAFFIIYNFFR